MPAITLVVCVHLQRDLLERLMRESRGCYDELIVLHDIPERCVAYGVPARRIRSREAGESYL